MDEFEQRWLAFVRRHKNLSREERRGAVEEVLQHGLPDVAPTPDALDDIAVRDRVAAEMDLVRAGDVFDSVAYWRHNVDLRWSLCRHDEQLLHFVTRGWKELRSASGGFDTWFYWNEHLDPTSESVNPLVHYLCEGRRLGLETTPARQTLPAPEPPADRPPRRVCLFAGFDVDGVIDQTVVDYIADLSRFADVYYLADCPIDADELAKLEPYTVGRWAERHGKYDFGSYSTLAAELVGWDVIDSYDELILANDSAYLVQSFEQVFARMDATTCDWWGLQATYDHFSVDDHAELGRTMTIEEAEQHTIDNGLWRYSDFLHVGSYFLVYRRRVIGDPDFRRRLDTVAAQSDKTVIILKYEIGLSRFLLMKGYHLATFVDGILPYHPVYRESAFELLRDGFPLLKRQFLYENPFSRPDLRLWKQRVLEIVPGADVRAMERNLRRVAPAWSLHRSFGIRSRADGSVELPPPIGPDTFDDEDRWVPKHGHWWLFPLDPRTGMMDGAMRAVFEQVRADPGIRKIVLTGYRPFSLGGANVIQVAAESAAGQMYALRSANVLVTVGPRADVNHPLSGARHRFILLGSPTGLQAPEVPLTNDRGARPHPDPAADRDLVASVVTASPAASRQALASLRRVTPSDVWETGSPRVDLLLTPEDALPSSLQEDLRLLRAHLAGRRLVVVSPLDGERVDVEEVTAWAIDHDDVVVCWVSPPGWQAHVPTPLVDLHDTRRLRPGSVTHRPLQVEMAWRLADVVATGWPADLADAAVIGVPTVALPGADGSPLPVQPSGGAALSAIEQALGSPSVDPDWLAWGRALHTASDGHSAARVVRAVRSTYLPLAEWEQDLTAG